MKPQRAVVLGSRFGGLAVISWLRRLFSPGELEITVIDQWEEMIFRPGLVHAMDTAPDRLMPPITLSLSSFWKRHKITSLHDTVVDLDPDRRLVSTATHPPLPYDVLFIATGGTARWDKIPGLDLSHQGLCEGYLARHTATLNRRSTEGQFVFAVGPLQASPSWTPTVHVGCECPLIESALLWDAHLRRLNTRESSSITVITPASHIAEVGGPVIQARVEELLAERQIRLITKAQFVGVTPSTINLDRHTIPYDRAVWVPPMTGAQWLQGSPVADDWGWIPTDEYLNHPQWSDIYAVGDVVSHAWPKMGHAAMVQARISVHHWHQRQTARRTKLRPFAPRLLWILETGSKHALFALSDVFYGGGHQWVYHGQTPYWAKQSFQWAYVHRRGALPIMP